MYVFVKYLPFICQIFAIHIHILDAIPGWCNPTAAIENIGQNGTYDHTWRIWQCSYYKITLQDSRYCSISFLYVMKIYSIAQKLGDLGQYLRFCLGQYTRFCLGQYTRFCLGQYIRFCLGQYTRFRLGQYIGKNSIYHLLNKKI